MDQRWTFGLMGLAIGTALVLAGSAVLEWQSRPAGPTVATDAAAPLAVSVAGRMLQVPPALIRAPERRQAGAQPQLDLWFAWPDFTAPQPARRDRPPTPAEAIVFVSLQAADLAVPAPERRTAEVWGRFIESGAWSNPGGLIMRRFAGDSPYRDEELFLSPPDGERFTARCRKPAAPGERRLDTLGDACLWVQRRPPYDVQVRFAPALLAEWQRLDEQLDAALGRLGVPAR